MTEKDEIIPDVKMDYVLSDISNWADNGVNAPISITVNGIIYSGTAISGKEWCLRNISLFDQSDISEKFKSGIREYLNSIIDGIYNDENIEKNKAPQFLHMVVRYISTYSSGGTPESLWRFKIREIDAVMFGELSPK